MTRREARQLVHEDINASYEDPEDSLVIDDDATIIKPYGWIFFYQSKSYVDGGDPSDQLAGNGPVVFVRETSGIHRLGTALPIDEEVEKFERSMHGR